MNIYMVVLRFVHILTGAFWFGATVFMTLFLQRAAALEGPAGGAVMGRLAKIGMPVAFVGAMILSIGSGLLMFARVYGGVLPDPDSPTQLAFSIGGLAAILAFLEGLVVHMPLQKKMMELRTSVERSGGPPSPEQMGEMQKQLKHLKHAATISMVLLTIAISAMAVARYL